MRRTLNQLLKARTDPIQQLIEWSLSNVKPEDLTHAIQNNTDILLTALNHYHLGHPLVFPLFQTILKSNWNEAEDFLIHIPKLYAILSRNPENKALLDTQQGRDYLNRVAEHAYHSLHHLIWQ